MRQCPADRKNVACDGEWQCQKQAEHSQGKRAPAQRKKPGCNAAGKQRKQRLEQHKIKRRTAVQKQNGVHDNNIGKPQLHGGHQAKKRGKHGFQKRERHGKGKQHAKQGGLSGFVVLQGGFLHYFISYMDSVFQSVRWRAEFVKRRYFCAKL